MNKPKNLLKVGLEFFFSNDASSGLLALASIIFQYFNQGLDKICFKEVSRFAFKNSSKARPKSASRTVSKYLQNTASKFFQGLL